VIVPAHEGPRGASVIVPAREGGDTATMWISHNHAPLASLLAPLSRLWSIMPSYYTFGLHKINWDLH